MVIFFVDIFMNRVILEARLYIDLQWLLGRKK